MAEKAILFDTSRCTGCHGCQVACKCWNNLPSPLKQHEGDTDHDGNVLPGPVRDEFTGSHQNPADINGTTRLITTYHEYENDKYGTGVDVPLSTKNVQWAFGRRACQHCTDAGCIEICPAGAIYRDEETGLVTHDQSKCIGCQYCSAACPFDVPRYDGDLLTIINKCSGCVDRVANGMDPACVSICQPEALQFGDRDEMLALAHERLEMLKARGYEDACIYGEEEMGGLHSISVLKYGAEKHGMPVDPKKPAAVFMTQVMKPLTGVIAPVVVAGLGAMAALAVGYKRDTLVYNEETEDAIALETGEVVKHGDAQDERTFKEALTENLPFIKKKEGSDE